MTGLLGLGATACAPDGRDLADSVTVFAAASLTDALEDVAAAYERSSGRRVRLAFASSGGVARQVQAGAPADVVILADEIWMDRLSAQHLLAIDTRVDLLRNHLVLIASDTADTGPDPFEWLKQVGGRLAIGDPESVPAGSYARAWLQEDGRWNDNLPRMVLASDVRGVRAFVQRGEAALGVVYYSDTVGAPGVKVVARPAPGQSPQILYPAAETRRGAAKGKAFLAFARGAEARRIFEAHGFEAVA